jgi:hypothetical protein
MGFGIKPTLRDVVVVVSTFLVSEQWLDGFISMVPEKAVSLRVSRCRRKSTKLGPGHTSTAGRCDSDYTRRAAVIMRSGSDVGPDRVRV